MDRSREELLAQLGWARSLARTLVADPGLADDLAQDATLLALERLPEHARAGGALRAWVGSALRKLAHGRRRAEARREYRERAAARAEAQESPLEVVARAELHRRLTAAVLELDEPYRSTLLLRHLDGLDTAAIAARTGVAPAAVRQRLSRGHVRLRARLDAQADRARDWRAELAGLAAGAAPLPAWTPAALAATWLSVKLAAAAGLALALGVAVLLARGGRPAPPSPAVPEVALDDSVRAPEPPAEGAVDRAGRTAATAATTPGRLRITGRLEHVASPEVLAPSDAGVEVAIYVESRAGKGTATVTTDGDGRFRADLERPGDGPLTLSASVPSDDTHQYGTARRELDAGQDEALDLRLLRRPHGPLDGRVVDARGAPVPDLALTLVQNATTTAQAEAPPTVATTDAEGRFTVPDYRGPEGWSSHPFAQPDDDRWCVLQAEAPRRRATKDGWEPATLVVGRAGRLVVRLLDSDGMPLQGDVVLELAESEREAQTSPFSRRSSMAHTDAEGSARFDAAWSDRRLVLRVVHGESSTLVERVRDGVALLGAAPDEGEPLTVPAGGEVSVLVPLRPWWTVRGTVLLPDGKPASEAHVRLDERDVPTSRRGLSAVQLRTDAQGRFEWTSWLPPHGATLRVLATDEAADALATWTGPWGRPSWVAEELVPLPAAPGSVVDVALRAAPALTIAGRVLDAEGAPCRTIVRAVPEGASLYALGQSARAQAASTDAEGAFEVPGLVAGRYDLILDVPGHGFFTSSLVRRRTAGIEAGTRDLVLSSDEPPLVRVTLEVRAPAGVDVRSTGVTIAKVHARDRAALEARRPAARERFADRSGWLPAATLGLGGGQSFARDERAFYEGLYTAGVGDVVDLPALDAGLYWIGVRPLAEDGRALQPTGTGILDLRPGEYRFEFEVLATGEVSGDARGPEGPRDGAVCLVDGASGRPVHVRVGDRVQAIVPLASDGTFHLRGVPVGDYEAWFGTPAELAAGRPVHRTRVVVGEGENPPLTVDLPR